jgi:hypothetical protein
MGLGTAFRLFFKALGNSKFSEQARRILDEPALLEAPKPAAVVAPARPARPEPARSDALNLLAVLQREARLVDFFQESIDAYADAQIGAAVRNVHRDAAAVLDRLFALRPVLQQAEGDSVQVPAGSDAGRVRLVGNVAGQPPFKGTLRHPGWEATKVQLPEWSGGDSSARVVAPAEVEI